MSNKDSDAIPEVPGRPLNKAFATILKRQVAELFSINPEKFPGAQPVSFTLEHIQELKEENYFVCEKSDGMRVLMFARFNEATGTPETFLIDRKNDYRYLQEIHLPSPNANASTKGFHHLTIIDGELVFDREKDGSKVLRYLAFDLLCIDGRVMINRPFTSRQGHLRTNVVTPFLEYVKKNKIATPLDIQAKTMGRSYGMIHILKEEVPTLKHRSDGLIFTSVDAKYDLGTCIKMLKWKPPHENSVDFKLQIEGRGPTQPPIFHLGIWKGGDNYTTVDKMGVTSSEWRQWKSMFSPKPESRLDGRIVEVSYDPKHCPPHKWRFMRFRDDKLHANHVSVLEKIKKSIADNIDIKMLEQECPDIRQNWKDREAQENNS